MMFFLSKQKTADEPLISDWTSDVCSSDLDSNVEQFQAAGGSMVRLAKGNRSKVVTEACATHGGFYLGSIGGPAASLAQDCIKSQEGNGKESCRGRVCPEV